MLCLLVTSRLLPDQAVFSSVVVLLQSVQEQGDCVLPRSVLRSALYLLAVTQDRSPSLDGVSLISSPNREGQTVALRQLQCTTSSTLLFGFVAPVLIMPSMLWKRGFKRSNVHDSNVQVLRCEKIFTFC